MDWEECLRENVKRKRQDLEEARALLKMAERRELLRSEIKGKDEFNSIIIESYYESIKELITAIMSVDGYKSYSHKCLIIFMRKFYHLPRHHLMLIDQLRKLRNDINYRGIAVDSSYLERNERDIKNVISGLKDVLRRKLVK